MGQIQIEQTPRQGLQIVSSERFNSLQRIIGPTSGEVIGGKFQLPPEFDQNRFASKFVPEGNEVDSLRGPQPILGTPYVASGWEVWRYPEYSSQRVDEDSEEGKKAIKEKKELPFRKHPRAGKCHEVSPADKNGQKLVLMYRDINVQNQTNEVYGLVSLERMVTETLGGTVEGQQNTDSGMLPEERLKKMLGSEPDLQDADFGRSAVLNSSIQTRSGHLGGVERQVSF